MEDTSSKMRETDKQEAMHRDAGKQKDKLYRLSKLLRYYFGTDEVLLLQKIFENMKKASLARSLYEQAEKSRQEKERDKRLESIGQETENWQANREEIDLDAQAENPEFLRYVWDRGLSPQEAYLLLNREMVLKEAAKKAQAEIAASIAAKRGRMAELGMQKRTSSKRKRVRASTLGDEEIDDILARVKKGETIRF
jgi:hypothetical protein|nr:MAG TPA: hypothetical protein [Caudoviricetes sp.]